jgi:hypothetical protein
MDATERLPDEPNATYRRSQVFWALWVSDAGPFLVHPPLAGLPAGSPLSDGHSGDLGYSVEDALALGLGHDLVSMGLPHSEAAALIRAIRGELDVEARKLRAEAVHRPPKEWVGLSPVFLLLRPIMPAGVERQFDARVPKRANDRVQYLAPAFADGTDSLKGEAAELRGRDRMRMLIEIKGLYLSLFSFLQKAPSISRARKS